MRVSVYRNLKHGKSARPLYSIVQRGKVVARSHRVVLTNASFIVREGGRQRVLREGRKNVHAFVAGTLAPDVIPSASISARVRYNPHDAGAFTLDGRPVKGAGIVSLDERGILARFVEFAP